MYARLSFTLVL